MEDVDGNAVYKQYRISGDTVKPTINIKNPEKDMWVCDYSKNDLTLKFKGEKRNGIGMDNSSYSIKYGDNVLLSPIRIFPCLILIPDTFSSAIVP